MRALLLLLITFIVLSCHKPNTKVNIDKLIFLSYTWGPVDSTDNWNLNLHYYIEIDHSGDYHGFKNSDSLYKYKYFGGALNDSIKLRINTFLSGNYDSIYNHSDSGKIYCGADYFLDYRYKDRRYTIKFIPQYSTEQINSISKLFETIINKEKNDSAGAFEISQYKKELEILLKPSHPFPKREKPKVELNHE